MNNNPSPEPLPVGDPGPDSPDVHTAKEAARYSASAFSKYQIIVLQSKVDAANQRNIELYDQAVRLSVDCESYRARYNRAKDARASLAIESSLIQGMIAFAAALLGFIPKDNEWWRMLGWLLLSVGVILAVVKGLLINLLKHFFPSWVYDEENE